MLRTRKKKTQQLSHLPPTTSEKRWRKKTPHQRGIPCSDKFLATLEPNMRYLLHCIELMLKPSVLSAKSSGTCIKRTTSPAQTTAVLTNTAFLFIRARTAELLLETEDIREKLVQYTSNVLVDSDPLWQLWTEYTAQLQECDPRAVAMLRGDVTEDISVEAEDYVNTHYGLAIDALIQHRRAAKQSSHANSYVCARISSLIPPQGLQGSKSSSAHAQALAYKQKASNFFIREFVRSGKLVPEEEANGMLRRAYEQLSMIILARQLRTLGTTRPRDLDGHDRNPWR
jgi:hypothetical protein